jgi:hypothetical protein
MRTPVKMMDAGLSWWRRWRTTAWRWSARALEYPQGFGRLEADTVRQEEELDHVNMLAATVLNKAHPWLMLADGGSDRALRKTRTATLGGEEGTEAAIGVGGPVGHSPAAHSERADTWS